MAIVEPQADRYTGGCIHARGRRTGVEDSDTEPFLSLGRWVRQGPDHGLQSAECIVEAGAAQRHGSFIIVSLDCLRHLACLLHTFHERDADDPVGARADHNRFIVRPGFQNGNHSFVAEQGCQVAVIGAGASAALDVSEHGGANLLTQSLLQDALHIGRADIVPITVLSALGHDDDMVSAACPRPGFETLQHNLLPVIHIWWSLGDQDPVCSGGKSAVEGQVAAIASHHLDDEGALVAGGGAGDGIHRVGDAVQGAIRADGHLGAGKVVVDRADNAHDQKVLMSVSLLLGKPPALDQLRKQGWPFTAEDIGTGQRAVSADDDQAIYAMLHQVQSGLPSALTGTEFITAGRTNNGATLVQNAADRIPVHLADLFTAIHQSLIAFVDCIDLSTPVQSRADHCADRGIHTLGVASTGEYCYSFH